MEVVSLHIIYYFLTLNFFILLTLKVPLPFLDMLRAILIGMFHKNNCFAHSQISRKNLANFSYRDCVTEKSCIATVTAPKRQT